MQKALTLTGLFLLTFIAAFSQDDYRNDANGNLINDNNKGITSIHYNHLNLVDTIAYSDGRKMIYAYTAAGQKLKEQSILANGTSNQKRDYVAHVLYRNDSLQEIKHEDGRSVPEQPGNANTTWEYQYHLTDHLGNVRSTLTSEPEEEIATATLETEQISTEQSKFLHYDAARRINSVLFDHTKKGTSNFAQRLNGSANEKYGIAKSISVMPGDTLRLEAYAKYVDPNTRNWSQALTTMLTQIATGTAPAGTVVDGGHYAASGNTPFSFAGLNGTSGSTGSGPKAFLNWVVFDRNFVFKNGGYVKVSEAAKENGSNVPHEKLAQELIIHEPGYVYVYVSNEETTPVDVYFDDFSVTQIKGPVIQESDYDPFGLTFNEYTRENSVLNNFLYNGKELQKDFDLNWYDYGARMYDAALGRWHVIDPLAEKYGAWSPYNYVMNNPIKFVDPDGRELVLVGDKDGKVQQIIAKLKKEIPKIGEFITAVENSEHTALLHVSPGKGDIMQIFEKNDAIAKGEKGLDGKRGTGKGSSVYFKYDPSSEDPNSLLKSEDAITEVAVTLGAAYKAVKGKFTLESFSAEGEDGEKYELFTSFLQDLNVINIVRGHEGRPYKRNYGRVIVLDDKGNPTKDVKNIILSVKEIEKINASKKK